MISEREHSLILLVLYIGTHREHIKVINVFSNGIIYFFMNKYNLIFSTIYSLRNIIFILKNH